MNPGTQRSSARAEAEKNRAALRETVEALQNTVDAGANRFDRVVENAKESLKKPDELFHRHPWVGVALALGFGVAFGRGGRRKVRRTEERMLVVREAPRRSALDSFFGALGKAAAAGVAAWAKGELTQFRNQDQEPPNGS